MGVPESVLGQLANSAQHALRVYIPKDQKAVRAAGTTFRTNPDLATELGVGEASVSVLMNKAGSSIVQRVLIRPPHCQIGPINAEQRRQLINGSELYGKYKQSHDPASAYEELQQRTAKQAQLVVDESKKDKTRASKRPSVGGVLVESVVRSIGSSLGRQIIRSVLGH